MSDFDNGLPPVGTTINSKITDVVLQTQEESDQHKVYEVKGVISETSLYKELESAHVNTVLVEKSPAGLNYGTFL